MSAVSLLLWRDLGRRLTGWHGIASHRIFESGRGEDESQADRFGTNVLRAYPCIRRNKYKSSRVEIALLISEPNVRRSALNQQDFILGQVPVFLNGRSWGKVLRPRYQMLRAVVFRADLQHELGGGGGTLVRVNAASPQLAFIPFQEKGLHIGLWSCAGLI